MSALAAALVLSAVAPAEVPAGGHERPGITVVAVDAASPGAARLVDATGLAADPNWTAVWVWSAAAPPSRIERQEWESWKPPAAMETSELEVSDPRTELQRRGVQAPALVAAPPAMWREVPFHLLPRWQTSPTKTGWRAIVPKLELRMILTSADLTTGILERSRGALRPLELQEGRSAELVIDAGAAPATELQILSRVGSTAAALVRFSGPLVDVPSLPPLEKSTWLVHAKGFVPKLLESRVGDLPARITLDPGCEVALRTLDASSDDRPPIGGVEIVAEAAAGTSSIVRQHARSGAAGEAMIEALPRSKAILRVRHPGYATRDITVDLSECIDRLAVGDVQLTRAATLRLRVVDDRAEPVSRASAAVRGESTTTNAEGRAELRRMDPQSPGLLSVSAPGHVSKTVDLATPLPESMTVALERAFIITGTVRGADGSYPPNVALRFEAGGGFDTKEGANPFEVERQAGEDFVVEVVAPGWLPARVTVRGSAPGERRDLGEIVLSEGVEIVLRAVDAATLTPIGGARAWVPAVRQEGPLVAWSRGDVIHASAGADGVLRLAGLLPRPALALEVEAAGFARRSVEVLVGDGERVIDLGDLPLDPGHVVRVVGSEDDPSGIAQIDPTGRWLEHEMITAPYESGEAILRDVAAGRVRVSVVSGRRVLCEDVVVIESDAVEHTVPCDAAGRVVRGRVIVGGQPDGPGHLEWISEAPDVAGMIERSSSALGVTTERVLGAGRPSVGVEVNSDGSFTSTELGPGRWRVMWSPAAGVASKAREVVLADQEESWVELVHAISQIRGRVVDDEGRPVAGAFVRAEPTGGLAVSDAEGQFRLVDVEPGVVSLQAVLRERRSSAVQVQVEPDTRPPPVELVIGEHPGHRVSVSVAGGRGGGVAGALIVLEGADGVQRLLTTDLAGRAEVEWPSPYPAGFRVAVLVAGAWSVGDWTERGEESTDLRIEARSGAGILIAAVREGAVSLVGPGGWDVDALLSLGGASTWAVPGEPFAILGLPAGELELSVAGGPAVRVFIEAGEMIEVVLP